MTVTSEDKEMGFQRWRYCKCLLGNAKSLQAQRLMRDRIVASLSRGAKPPVGNPGQQFQPIMSRHIGSLDRDAMTSATWYTRVFPANRP